MASKPGPQLTADRDSDRPWWTGRRWQVSLWVALAIAFSPVLVDLSDHWVVQPWSRACLLFPGLVWLASRQDTVRPGPASWGWALVAAGIVLELLAIGGDVVRMGRVGLVAASIGLCFAGGWSSIRVALLLVWSIPLPASVLNFASPAPEKIVGELGARIVSLFGVGVERVGTRLEGGGSIIELLPADGGLQSAVTLAGLGWFSALLRPTAPLSIARTSILWGLSAFPIHVVLVGAASLALAAGLEPGVIRRGLAEFSWAGILLVGLLWVWIDARLRAPGTVSPEPVGETIS